ncbi:hypothetical protein KAI68_04300 [bacterium]|nr:hypothetical protein [bacterium]
MKSYAFTNGQNAYDCLGQFDISNDIINDTLNNRLLCSRYASRRNN